MSPKPLVSICITTYNHVNYIRQALDGVLMQETNFPYEILLGEDASNDGTREICREYLIKHPDKIKLFLHTRETVIYIDGRPTGRYNFINNLSKAKGKYIALLDGDDYWTDEDKLQKQVDFLEKNSEFTICFHNVQRVYEGTERLQGLHNHNQKEITTIEDLAAWNYIATCSVVYRRNLFSEFPDWYAQAPSADWPLHLLNAEHGPIKYIDKVMSSYRIHDGGIWSSRNGLDVNKKTLAFIEVLDKHFNYKYADAFEKNKLFLIYTNLFDLNKSSKYFLFFKHLIMAFVFKRKVRKYTNIDLLNHLKAFLLYNFKPKKSQ